jgi:putative tryptophan/tyrosine transport system substrate-binding protein
MRRRSLIALLGGAAAAWPLDALGQQSVAPVVAVLAAGSHSGFWGGMLSAFGEGLGSAGYSEGRNVTIEARWAEDHNDRLPALATELIGYRPAVLAAFATAAAKAAKSATTTIPVVFATIADPVQIGLVASLNHPGGNVTGVTQLSVEVEPKLMELLHQAVPSAAIVALLVNPTNPNAPTQWRSVQEAAQRLGVQLHVLNASTPADFDPLFAKMQDLQVAALIISQDVLFGSTIEQLGKLAVRHNIPGIYFQREFAAAGGLMSYGTDARAAYRQVGIYAGRILKGERPSDLPVIQAAKFDLTINLKTAKALGLDLPLPLLGRADEIIE